jgi:mRNA interferase RelE/StbE
MLKRNKADLYSSYKIFETNEFIKILGKINSNDREFIENKLHNYIYPQIKEQPYFGINIKKLKAYNPETWRYRLGKFRLFYIIEEDEKIVYILTIDDRKDAYK